MTDADDTADELALERIAQGLPPRVTDPDLLARVASLITAHIRGDRHAA